MTLTTVNIFALGGTIAMAGAPRGRGAKTAAPARRSGSAKGVVPRLTAKALTNAVPELSRIARIKPIDFRRLPGAHLTDNDLVELARTIIKGRNPAVVTQGTDTLEETAFALDLMVGTRVPVVVTGALRHPGLAGADGPANLLAAVTVAASEAAEGLGTLVVMGDRIHAAALVRKTNATAPDAFTSPNAGPIGFLAESQVRILLYPAARTAINPVIRPKDMRPVVIITAHQGDTGEMLRAALDRDIAGVVIAAMGAGHLTPKAADAAEQLCRQAPVVLASRTGAGPVLMHTYAFTGSESDLASRGLIRAGWLDAPKARILLALARRAGFDRRRTRTAFAAYGGG
ncbi:MAG: L-asparaginase [Alphaproteobacteria bacterium]|jgi:L-asparaginase